MEGLTDYVVDTVALVKYLEDDLPPAADRAFKQAEDGRGKLYLPEIAFGEFAYIMLRGRVRGRNPESDVGEVLDEILHSPHIVLSNLTPGGWRRFLSLRVPELHDRMIAADAQDRGLELVTSDGRLAALPGLETVW